MAAGVETVRWWRRPEQGAGGGDEERKGINRAGGGRDEKISRERAEFFVSVKGISASENQVAEITNETDGRKVDPSKTDITPGMQDNKEEDEEGNSRSRNLTITAAKYEEVFEEAHPAIPTKQVENKLPQAIHQLIELHKFPHKSQEAVSLFGTGYWYQPEHLEMVCDEFLL
uniref:Uncharacterized protein n=1 Tax=Aegilops tauschii TaxID=37682 RepID=M8AIR1_AEGTA